MTKIQTYSLLALLGAFPFVACAILPLFGLSAIYPIGSLDAVAASYGVAISSFVAGSHWGIYLREESDVPVNLFYTSNVALLAVWIAYVAGPLSWQLSIQIATFAFLWLTDRQLRGAEFITAHYLRIRGIATAVVCASLALIVATG